MAVPGLERITLDYLGAVTGNPKLLTNLSAVAAYGDYLWTASDEGRTIECLKRDGDGYRLHDQIKLDDICNAAPDASRRSVTSNRLSICGKELWICGSHCRVRTKPKKKPGDDGPDRHRAVIGPQRSAISQLRIETSALLFRRMRPHRDPCDSAVMQRRRGPSSFGLSASVCSMCHGTVEIGLTMGRGRSWGFGGGRQHRVSVPAAVRCGARQACGERR